MREPTFDIFMGESEKDAIWLESIAGLPDAKQRMEHYAAKNPGQYFIWSHAAHSILAGVNTFSQMGSLADSSAAAS